MKTLSLDIIVGQRASELGMDDQMTEKDHSQTQQIHVPGSYISIKTSVQVFHAQIKWQC